MFFSRTALTLVSLVVLSACAESNGNADSAQTNASSQTKSLDPYSIEVYKSPTCGCCKGWVEHIETAGFSAETHHPDNLAAVKDEYGIAPQYRSCHLGVSAEGYVFEGHVPGRYIQQFLEEKPADAIGLAVPGMPVGSPGMEANGRFDPYQVLLLKNDGSYQVYARINRPEDQ